MAHIGQKQAFAATRRLGITLRLAQLIIQRGQRDLFALL